MRNPFKYRPEDVPTFETAPHDWTDNWLSNFFAWASLTFLGPWCSTPEHWTSAFMRYMFTSCPCCLIFRGVAIGIFVASVPFVLIIAAMIVL
jgi:hypothetical protein